VLDTTSFYPGGGGQPSDRGAILRATDGRTWVVKAARRMGGEIVHEVEATEDGELPAPGDEVTVDLELL
jgi:Ser-tRNA(Ala) deacylase AlaX